MYLYLAFEMFHDSKLTSASRLQKLNAKFNGWLYFSQSYGLVGAYVRDARDFKHTK